MVSLYCCTKPTVAIDLSDAVIVDSSNVYYQELEDSPHLVFVLRVMVGLLHGRQSKSQKVMSK